MKKKNKGGRTRRTITQKGAGAGEEQEQAQEQRIHKYSTKMRYHVLQCGSLRRGLHVE
jgi:hypothetical protein